MIAVVAVVVVVVVVVVDFVLDDQFTSRTITYLHP